MSLNWYIDISWPKMNHDPYAALYVIVTGEKPPAATAAHPGLIEKAIDATCQVPNYIKGYFGICGFQMHSSHQLTDRMTTRHEIRRWIKEDILLLRDNPQACLMLRLAFVEKVDTIRKAIFDAYIDLLSSDDYSDVILYDCLKEAYYTIAQRQWRDYDDLELRDCQKHGLIDYATYIYARDELSVETVGHFLAYAGAVDQEFKFELADCLEKLGIVSKEDATRIGNSGFGPKRITDLKLHDPIMDARKNIDWH